MTPTTIRATCASSSLVKIPAMPIGWRTSSVRTACPSSSFPRSGRDSPELKGAELLIVDSKSAAGLGDAGPPKRVLLSDRGSTIDLTAVQGRFADIIVVPAPAEEVVARVRHVLDRT